MLMTNDRQRVKFNVDKENKQYQSWRKNKEKKRTEQTLGHFLIINLSLVDLVFLLFSFYYFNFILRF
jgi:hypothetical protein